VFLFSVDGMAFLKFLERKISDYTHRGRFAPLLVKKEVFFFPVVTKEVFFFIIREILI